jgi:GNAT superfamily N-acetyltransferase
VSRSGLRPMTALDIEPAVASILADDWGDRRGWFEYALANPACRAIVAVADDDRPIGTAVLSIHGSVGWIGTIWVASAWRRQGLGLALTQATIDAADGAGCRTMVLVATETGRPMYERLGFAVHSWYRTMQAPSDITVVTTHGPRTGVPATAIRAYRAEDLPSLAALDRTATGEDRSAALAMLASPDATRVLERDGSIAGYVARAPWGGGATIAPRIDDALALIDTRRSTSSGRPIRCGILLENKAGARALAERGWVEAWRAPRLVRGDPLAWHPSHIWGQFNHAMG